VPILVQDTRHAIGHVGLGDMKLNEFFPSAEEPNDDQDIDWLDDLKFFIDNEPKLLSNYIFPAIKKHEKYVDHPKAYKIYIKPLNACMKKYCETFDIEEQEKKFSEDSLIELAKKIAEEQKKHIEDGDYETK
jgi:hypothetical protein